MAEAKTEELSDPRAAQAFYEDRYAHGYMEEWPDEKKRRIAEVVGALGLPPSGSALDFGCGNGVLTDVLRRALPPGWSVLGTDLSANAVKNARERFPGSAFATGDSPEVTGQRFDLVFTHHVLEHVHDVREILDSLAARVAPGGGMLHILPCGNPGSYEHGLCLARIGGIESARENRFFFEEEGHLRRLSTDDMRELCAARGFRLAGEWYSNQRDGAFAWLTLADPGLIADLTDERRAVDRAAARKLRRLRRQLKLLRALRLPAYGVDARLRRGLRSARDWAILAVGLPLYPLSKLVDAWIERRWHAEWRARKRDPRGSEMFLWLQREC